MRYVIALLLAVLMILGMEWFMAHTVLQADTWVSLGRELTAGERLSFFVAVAWRQFRWFVGPILVAGFLILAALTKPRAKASAHSAQ